MINYKKTISAIVVSLALIAGLSGSASASPLNWSADTSVALTNPSTTVTILSGSTADSITVNAGSVDVTMSSGQTFTLRSTSRKTLSHNSSALAVNTTCGDSYSQMVVSDSNTSSSTFKITVSSDTCAITSGGNTGGSSGGASGGTTTTTTTTTTTPTTTTPTTTTPTTTTPATTTPATTPATVSYPDGTLLKSTTDPKVYVIKNGEKVWIKTAKEFKAGKYKWANVKTVSPDVLTQVGAAAPPASVSGTVKVVNTSTLKVRASNTSKSRTLGKVAKNETFTILEEKNGWYKITTKTGVTGWISGAYAVKQ